MAGRHVRKESLDDTGASRHKTLWIVLSTILVALLVLGGGAYYWLTRPLTHNIKYPDFPAASANTTNTAGTSVPAPDPTRLNVLLIGTDTRPGETGGNTDTLILASIDPHNKRIEMLSIPRDSKVMYPDGSYAKINEALMLGGPNLTESLVEQLTGQPIDHYALTHFGGLIQIINTIGGVTVDVKERMYYNTGDKEYNIINLKPGVQTLDGVQALGFVRFRHDALGDIGRTERQQEFLKALSEKLLQPQNITKLPTLIREFWGTIDTDMSLLDVLKVAANAQTYKGYQIIHETLPGSFHNPDPKVKGDESYWIVNPLEAKYMSTQFFENGLVQKNPIQPPSVTENWSPPTPGSTSATNTTNTSNPTNTGNGTDSSATTSSAGASTTNTASTTSGNNGSSNNGSSNNGSTGIGNTSSSESGGTGNANSSDANSVPATVPPTATGPDKSMIVTATSAYIRSGPATTYPIIASVLHGQTVSVVGTSGKWDEVVVGNGRMGYIAGWLLSPAS